MNKELDQWYIQMVDYPKDHVCIGCYVIDKLVEVEDDLTYLIPDYRYRNLYMCRDGAIREHCLDGVVTRDNLNTREEILASPSSGYFPTLEEAENLMKSTWRRYKIWNSEVTNAQE